VSESIAHLDDETSVDPRGTLRGAWREIGVRYVAAGATVRLVADGSEHAIYVWSGYGTAVTSEGAIDVAEGSAFTIVRGDSVSFEAGAEGLRLFVATLGA
jgi:quercetin dioxygenase-like cupin family protein